MTLLWLALAYFGGLVAAVGAERAGWIGCGLPRWLWIVPLALLPLVSLIKPRYEAASAALRWPESAGFKRPLSAVQPALLAGCVLTLVTGFLRAGAQPLYPCWTPSDLAFHNLAPELSFDAEAPRIAVTGIVNRYVSTTESRQRLYVEANSMTKGGIESPITGALTLADEDVGDLRYGDPVRVYGVLSTPPVFDDFSWRDYLARQGVHSQMTMASIEHTGGTGAGNPALRVLYGIRSRGEGLINQMLPEPYAALANGMLLGIESNIPDDLMADFNDTSASHVIVISGSNVAIISGVLLALTARFFGRRRASWATLVGIALYAVLVGGEPSVVRAAVMGGLVVLAVGLRRRSTALVSLAAACLMMGLWNPRIEMDVGFQLSVAATAGLILIAPRLRPRTVGAPEGAGGDVSANVSVVASGGSGWWSGPTGFVADSLAVTLAASLAVTPLLLYHFQRLSLIGLLTNLLIVPVQPLILLAGSAALTVGLAGLLPIAQLLFWGSWLGLAWTVGVVERSAEVRWASVVVGNFGMAALAITYVLMGVVLWQGRLKRGDAGQVAIVRRSWMTAARSPVVVGCLAACAILVWAAIRSLPDGRLHVVALPVDRGSALWIETPSGRTMLVGGGDDGAELLNQLGAVLPFWRRSIDLLVLDRADKKLEAAQESLPRRLQIGQALSPGAEKDHTFSWRRALEEAGIPVTEAAAGAWVDLGDGVALWVVGPTGDPKGKALALQLVYGDFSVDLPATSANDTASGGAKESTIVIAPDLGAGNSGWTDALAGVKAETIISYDDALRLPSPRILYPSGNQRVHIVSDGKSWRFE
jgi:competence protein ComEC